MRFSALRAPWYKSYLAGGTEFTASITYDDHIRLPYTAPEAVLHEGVRRLGEAWREYRAQL